MIKLIIKNSLKDNIIQEKRSFKNICLILIIKKNKIKKKNKNIIHSL